MQDPTWHAPEQDPIRERTSDRANQRIDQQTRGAIAEATSPAAIRARLGQLDREWTIDRALMLNFAIIGGIASMRAMGNMRRRGWPGGWGALFVTQLGFLAYHALKRWCPPMPVFRRLGFRSDREIAEERVVLEKKLAAAES
jgi:hypothetical protein